MFRRFEAFELDGPGIAEAGARQVSALLDRLLRGIASADISSDSLGAEIGDCVDGVAITLWEPGLRRLRVVRRADSVANSLAAALRGVRKHTRWAEFSGGARLQVDFLSIGKETLHLGGLKLATIGPGRFEFGVDGLLLRHDKSKHYFLPGDAFTRSVNDFAKLRKALSKSMDGIQPDRCSIQRIRSVSVLWDRGRWLRLWRGYPERESLTVADVRAISASGIGNILAHARPDGRFLYYYDAAKDSEKDHEHPKADPGENYNELRHCGGILALLLAASQGDARVIRPVVDRAVDFITSNSRSYRTSRDESAREVLFKGKSKLGAAGLMLAGLAQYAATYGDDRHAPLAREYANHIRSEIGETGEFRYFSVYRDAPVSWAENNNYFSFYYPGEALFGLALYLKHLNADPEWRAEAVKDIRRAMHYLLVRRPAERAEHYLALPSDAWLMNAVNEMHDLPELQDSSWRNFVFRDANQMIAHMYDGPSAIFPDYVGCFFYSWGDPAYADGARCEGLVAALDLAMKIDDATLTARYTDALVKTVRGTLPLANIAESLYFAANPAKAVGGIRLKHTRQWFRVDTIQHVVCHHLRFLSLYDRLLPGLPSDVARFDAA